MNEWQNMNKSEKRVLVGMSGGIDSTATCLMLREQGYEIVGLTMWVWGDEPVEARNLADSMGIEHHVADEREAFRQIIVQNFIDEYRRGRTPNPCVMCNPLFKFRDGVGRQAGMCIHCYRTLHPSGGTEREGLHCCRG